MLLPQPGGSLISRAPVLVHGLLLVQKFAGSLESFHLLKSRREVEEREMFQFVNLPALQTSNRAKGNQKALQHSSHGKRSK